MAVPVLVQEEEEDQEALVENWTARALTVAANRRHVVAARTSTAITYAEAAGATLQEAAALLQEASDVAEILYADVLKLVSPGPDPILYDALDAAAKLVDSVFTGAGAGPLTGAIIRAAGDLVASVSAFPPPVVGPLQGARRNLGILIQAHTDAVHLFNLCAPELGLLPVADTLELWVYQHEQTTAQASEARMRVNAAVRESIEAYLCLAQAARPGEYMSKAEQILREAINEVDTALVAMGGLLHTVATMELFVRHAIAQAP